MTKAIDITGKKFSRLTVISRAGKVGSYALWLCKCECGKEITVNTKTLNSGRTRSCGCLRSEEVTRRNKKLRKEKRIISYPEYSSWNHMKSRCLRTKDVRYQDYGGRGITICERWINNFDNFRADMGPRPSRDYSLDRIDVNGNYEPSNCRWATATEQRRNRRDSV